MKDNLFVCLKCGKCCREFLICVAYSDIMRWTKQNRQDILREVVFARGCPAGDGFYFEKTVTAPKKPCPFLDENNMCSIYETRPTCCKDAPFGFDKFDLCKAWNSSMIDERRIKNIRKRQDKDFRKCVTYFKKLLEITLKARGWEQLKVNM